MAEQIYLNAETLASGVLLQTGMWVSEKIIITGCQKSGKVRSSALIRALSELACREQWLQYWF